MTGILLLLLPIVHALSYLHGNGQLTARLDGELEFYHLDSLGSTRTITNEDADVIEDQLSLPFGGILSGDERYGFTGKELDESGLQYFGARYYDSGIGRFISTDPVLQGHSPYVYAANNPLAYRDPDGKVWQFALAPLMLGVATFGSRYGPEVANDITIYQDWEDVRKSDDWTTIGFAVLGIIEPFDIGGRGLRRLGEEVPKILEIGAGKGGFLAIMKKVGKLPADAKLIEVDGAGKDIASQLISRHKGTNYRLPETAFRLSSSNTQNVIADIAPDASWLLKQEGIDMEGIISLPFRDGSIYRAFYNNPVVLSENLGREINRILLDGELVLQFSSHRLKQTRFSSGLNSLIRGFGGPHKVSLEFPKYHEYPFRAMDGTPLQVDRMIRLRKPPTQ